MLEAILLVIFGTMGGCALITCIGYWGTKNDRWTHERAVFQQREEAKLNAITIAERDNRMLAMQTVVSSQLANAPKICTALHCYAPHPHPTHEPEPGPYEPGPW